MRKSYNKFFSTPGNSNYKKYAYQPNVPRRNINRQRYYNNNNNSRNVNYNRKPNNRNYNRNQRKRRFVDIQLKNNKFGFNPRDAQRYHSTIDKLTDTLGALTLNQPARNNVVKTNPRSEIRYDKLYTAYDMYRMNKYYPIYKSTLPLIYYPVYNEYTITILNTNSVGPKYTLMWLPYAFPALPDIKVQDNREVQAFASVILLHNHEGYYYNLQPSTLISIKGQQRLISATMKITNVTSMLNKAGTFTAYKFINEFMSPLIYNNQLLQYQDLEAAIPQEIQRGYHQAYADKSAINPKMLATANQTLTINEFNVVKGLDIFQGTDEYMGNKYLGNGASSTPLTQHYDGFNPIASNITYAIDFLTTDNNQQYKVQTWQIFEISPSNNLFSPMATIHNNCVTKAVRDRMETNLPFKTQQN
jgi:hypothetical protein